MTTNPRTNGAVTSSSIAISSEEAARDVAAVARAEGFSLPGLGGPSDMIRESERRVMPYEAELAKKITHDEFKAATGLFPPAAAGYFVYIRIHQSDPERKVQTKDGEKTLITKTHRSVNDEKYSSCVGLVIDIGPQAYTGNNFDGTPRFPDGAWCNIGDWVIVPRQEGVQISYGASREQMVPLIILPDDKIMGIVPDPKFVIATHLLDQDGR